MRATVNKSEHPQWYKGRSLKTKRPYAPDADCADRYVMEPERGLREMMEQPA
jgi:hypothetical protein